MRSSRVTARGAGGMRAKRVSVYVYMDRVRLLTALSALSGESISALVRRAIDGFLEEHATAEAFAALLPRPR